MCLLQVDVGLLTSIRLSATILIGGIGLVPFVFLSSSFPLTVYLVVLALSPMISLVICTPKGKWRLLIMTLNQAVVYALTVLAMHFST